MSTVPKGYKDIVEALKAHNIGIAAEYDEELEALVVGGLEGATEYSGVRVEIHDDGPALVLEVVFSADVESQEDALLVFDEVYGDLLYIEDESLELEYDEEMNLWGVELLRPVDNLDDLVAGVEEALEHGLFFNVEDVEECDECDGESPEEP